MWPAPKYILILLISWDESQVQLLSFFFFFCSEPIWLAHCKKTWNYWRLPKIEDSMERWSASPFGSPLWVRRGGLWALHMGLKRGAIGNTLGEHIGNLMGTHWVLEGNMLGTKEKWEKNQRTLRSCWAFMLTRMKFLFPKLFVTIFGLG
jgi:hypothetical protein